MCIRVRCEKCNKIRVRGCNNAAHEEFLLHTTPPDKICRCKSKVKPK